MVISRDWKTDSRSSTFWIRQNLKGLQINHSKNIFFSAYYGILSLVPKFFDKKSKDQLRNQLIFSIKNLIPAADADANGNDLLGTKKIFKTSIKTSDPRD